MRQTRREVIQLATAAMAMAQAKRGRAQENGTPGGEISVWTTAGDKRMTPGAGGAWRAAHHATAAVVLDPDRQFQEVLGFGAAFTDAACQVLHRLPAAARAQVLHDLLHPSGLGLNVFRICIGASDYASEAYSFDEGTPDPELTRFSIDHDRAHILPVLREARVVNPDLFLLASPWSPPGWMKANGSLLGGSMRKSAYGPYARYFVKFLKSYAEAGIPVQAVTVQNEVDTDQDGRMPACLWGQEYEMEFVARHLGPALAADRMDTRIWILDHNYNLWGRALDELDDPEVSRYVDGVAWHGYMGQPSAMSRVHDAHPAKHMYWTEGGPDVRDPHYQDDWSHWGATFASVLENWSRCIIGWNIALDEAGKPNIGPFECGGVLTVDSHSGEIRRSGQYWALAHYARALRRGARRIASSTTVDGLWHVAAAHPDGSYGAVLTNAGAERRVALRLKEREAEIVLPSDSMTTLVWRS